MKRMILGAIGGGLVAVATVLIFNIEGFVYGLLIGYTFTNVGILIGAAR